MKSLLERLCLRNRKRTCTSLFSITSVFFIAGLGGILISLSSCGSNLQWDKGPQPPWWQPLPIIGIIFGSLALLALLIFLALGPTVLALRRYHQKYNVPAFADEPPSPVAEIEKVAQINPANSQEVAAAQLAISSRYYESVLQQAQQSFRWALFAAVMGLLFFLAAVSFMLLRQPENISLVSLISGAIVEVISAINFYLYGRASNQLARFHIRLDEIQRFVIANSVCESLEGEVKQTARVDLIRTFMSSSGTSKIQFALPSTKEVDLARASATRSVHINDSYTESRPEKAAATNDD